MTQPPAGQLSAFYPPYYQGGGGGQLDPHLNLANDLRLVYQHTSYKERVARATRNVLDQVTSLARLWPCCVCSATHPVSTVSAKTPHTRSSSEHRAETQ